MSFVHVYYLFFYMWYSGAGVDEDSWHQIRGGLAHTVLSEAFFPGPGHWQTDRGILLYEVSFPLCLHARASVAQISLFIKLVILTFTTLVNTCCKVHVLLYNVSYPVLI